MTKNMASGALNKNPTVWLDGARPSPYLSFTLLNGACTCAAVQRTLPQKYVCKYKKLAKFGEIILFGKKSEKEFDKLTFGNSEFAECEI